MRVKENQTNKNFERLKILNEKLLELNNLKLQLDLLEERKPQIEELRVGISLLADCREAVALADEKDKKRAEIELLATDKQSLQTRLEADILSISALEKKIEESDFDGKISECVELSAKYSACNGKPEKLELLLNELEKRRSDYKRLEEEKQKLLIAEKEAEKDAAQAEKELAESSSRDILRLINVEFKGAVLKEEYAANLDYLADLYGNIKIFEEDSPLYNYVSGELKAKINEYKERLVEVRSFKTEAITEQLKKLQDADKEREIKSKSYNEVNSRLQKLTAAITVKQNETETALKDGRELRQRADELKEELELIFGADCKDYQKAVNANTQRLSSLREEKLELLSKLEALNTSKHNLSVSKERLEGLLLAAQSEYSNLEEKLNKTMKVKRLESIQECRALFEKFKHFTDAESAVAKFDTQFSVLTTRKKELENTPDIFTATEEVLLAAEREKSAIYEGITDISNKIAVLESEKISLENRLNEKSEILKEFEIIQKERNLLARLKEATKGNKFLEYIANEYLSEISALASSTLLNLTGGRYFLVYKENNFSVADNFNCGNLRGVNTLSGGETFLVSLSLALALSQTICSKSMKSIEFFFLDEGFGTLDGALVDTVMNALEKLKSSSFTIGVISHVEELKYRISNKIIVNKATENRGSTLSFSC
ncbi:MAG: SMC family ATPase [Clostridia bacterium]|nr:SMC family ATPase [Clostridia bacterium]